MSLRSAAIALIFPLLLASSGYAATSSTPLPRFTKGPCAVEVSKDEKIDCGTLFVPENRHQAETATIELPVMIFRSRAATPAVDPLLFMPGGPGNSAITGRRSGKGLPYLDERDYILVEQRGTRLAKPALECPAINQLRGEISAGRLRDDAAQSALLEQTIRCRKTLTAAGIDLDGYTSSETADDLEDLRKLLGITRWNLYGLSYSTRLMQTMLRKYPSTIRSVVLDSVLPIAANFDEVSAVNLLRSLHVMFDGCAVDPRCGKAFPDLPLQFAELVTRADREGIPLDLAPAETGGKPADIRGSEVVEAIYSALHDVDAIPYLPLIISRSAKGHYDELTQLVKGNQGPSRFTWGMRYSIWCSEEIPFEDAARITSQTSRSLGLGGVNEGAATPALCRAWNVSPTAPTDNEPVKTDVPVLIFSGEFDPDTPPDWGRSLLETMPNARFVEMRGRSHGAAFSACGSRIATAFLHAPGAALDVDCALHARGANFGLSAK